MSQRIIRTGIVDGVTARRKGNGDVTSLAIQVRFETELDTTYNYGDQKLQVDDITLSVAPGSPINPGNIVTLDISFLPPDGDRFVPALTVGATDESA